MFSKKNITLIIFLILALIGTLTLTFRTTIFIGKATGSNSPIALENSYLFASPLQAKADGKELIRITIFILDGRGLGVPNQVVDLNSPKNVVISPIQPTTDESGKAIFDLSSSSPINFDTSATIQGKSIPQKVKVVFY